MSELEACPFCRTKQLEVVKIDMKDPDRDLIKCRHCRGQVMRRHWNTRHITLSQAQQVLAEAGLVAVSAEDCTHAANTMEVRDSIEEAAHYRFINISDAEVRGVEP